MIAAQACILRKRSDGTPITDPSELIRCADYGEEGRASDPKIGAQVNAVARHGDAISLRNPVALYITSFSNDGINRQRGASSQASGGLCAGRRRRPGQTFGMGLHLVYEVPARRRLRRRRPQDRKRSHPVWRATRRERSRRPVRAGLLARDRSTTRRLPVTPSRASVAAASRTAERSSRAADAQGSSGNLGQSGLRGDEEPLDVNDIQGNSLAGFRKDHQRFLFFAMDRTPDGTGGDSALAARLAPRRELGCGGSCVQSTLPIDEAPAPATTHAGSLGHVVKCCLVCERPSPPDVGRGSRTSSPIRTSRVDSPAPPCFSTIPSTTRAIRSTGKWVATVTRLTCW